MPYTAERFRSRHPFEIFMLAASAMYGVGGLVVRQARPGSVQETLGHGGTTIWSVCLLVGSLLALMGIAWPRQATGLFLEQFGCFTVGAATFYYGAIVLYTNGPSATFTASVMIAFALACIVRCLQIRRFVKRVQRKIDRATGG